MMCPEREVQLNEYVDGVLSAAGRQGVEQHLAGCAGCRAAVAQLRELLAGARALPQSLEPARDLWEGIEPRIRHPRGVVATVWWREQAFWRGALAAAAVLVLALGIYRLTARPPARPGQGFSVLEAEYASAVDELARTLEGERPRLRPETVAVIERNLRILDQAVRESRDALARDPANPELRQLYAAAYRQKVDLLRWAARLATSS